MAKFIPNRVVLAFVRMKRVLVLATAITVAAAPIMIMSQTATAAQITNRSVTISSAQAGNTGTTYTFGFTTATAGAIQGLGFQACTTALGTCTAPTGLSFSGAAFSSQTGWTNATNFAFDGTGAGGCIAAANELCAKRTQVASETIGARTIVFTGITNQNSSNCSSAANCTFFVRMVTYSNSTYATAVDSGTMASSTTQLFTVNAAIQEQLAFCVGNTTINNATSSVPTCSTITGTSLNLGTLSSSNVSVSPVPSATYNGDANNGLAELSTNAVNGSTVNYDAIQQSGTNHQGALRVAGATCNAGTVNTDQCINSIGASKATLTAGTEDFGMAIAGINCSNVTAYTCTFSSGTFNLVPATNYNCNGIVGGSADTFDPDGGVIAGPTSCSYAWVESGTSTNIATSTTVVAGEALILKFAATPNLVTPTGSYTAQADFIATPTF